MMPIPNTKAHHSNSNIAKAKPAESYKPIRYINLTSSVDKNSTLPRSPVVRPNDERSPGEVSRKHPKKKQRKRSKNYKIKEKFNKKSKYIKEYF